MFARAWEALSQLDAIANEGLQAVEAELTTMAWARNQQIWLRLDQPHDTRMHCEIVDNHGEPLLMSNQELYSVMVQINWTLKERSSGRRTRYPGTLCGSSTRC